MIKVKQRRDNGNTSESKLIDVGRNRVTDSSMVVVINFSPIM